MAFVVFRDVRKIYQMGETQVCAADGLNFDIEQGELACIVGPSGSGKTTLLNMLGGMDTCTSGTITLAGREISAFGEKELVQYRRHEIGFVFQFYNLVQNLTALENVELAAQICEDPMPADEALAMVGLDNRMNNFPAQLSGGEQQRVILARALAQQTPCLILDEPTNHLDIKYQLQLMELVRKSGCTVVAAIHDLNLAAAYCDRLYAMKDGVIVGHGAPRELLTTDFLRALYEVEAEILSGRDGAMRVFFYSK